MLKITIQETSDSARFILEGRLVGPWVKELDHAWQRIRHSGKDPLSMDLTGVTFIEDDAKALLRRMWREGAVLIGGGCCTGHIVEEITQGNNLR